MLTLYFTPGTISVAVAIAIEEAALPYQRPPLSKAYMKGEFAEQGEGAIVPLALLSQANRMYGEPPTEGALRIGVDVARFGDDDPVIWPVRGHHAYAPTVIHGYDTVEVAGRVMQVADSLRRGNESIVVRVDVIGYGAGVVDVLRRRTTVRTLGINVAKRSDQPDKFRLLRDQLWWGIRTWLREGGTLAKDQATAAELLGAHYSYDVRGRVVVDGKDKMREIMGRSPDRADALALAVYTGGAPSRAGKRTGHRSSARELGRLL